MAPTTYPKVYVPMWVPTQTILSHWFYLFFIESSSLKRRFYAGLGDVKELDFVTYFI